MVADILGLSFDNPDEITERPMPMIKPFEDNNQEHTVFYNCADGSKARLHYQHTYSRRTGEVHTATTENRPDIVLTIVKPDGFELTYLFDAKYRLLDDNRLNQEDREELNAFQGADTPPADAINQMHRYRDAIYYGSDRQTHAAKEIIGGYVLFQVEETMKVSVSVSSIRVSKLSISELFHCCQTHPIHPTRVHCFMNSSPKFLLRLSP